ncbi:MAG: hypothetical protein K9M75_04130 [Phycisphaerae bacterium]|nr:hypothetical protein [Phycisphaerae bacterium]
MKPSKPLFSHIIAFIAGCIICGGSFFLLGSGKLQQTEHGPKNVDQLLNMSEAEIAKLDIGLVNLLCAEGLDGSEDLDIDKCLATIDEWAEFIRKDTQARMPAYFNNPAKYDNSVNLFKIVTMILCLKNDIGVDYNQDIMKREVFPDSKDVFIHGCLTGKKHGGCVSIPTLCVAVGRRLGYPLKLVCTKRHVFFRWDDGKEVFNMEACCPGCDTHPDDYYKKWPTNVTATEIRVDKLLQSLTPSEEMALFLETRGHCLFDTGRAAEAQLMYANAYKLMPTQVKLANIDQLIKSEIMKIRNAK